MPMSVDILVAEYDDILEKCVQAILEHHQAELPDLSSVCVILPNTSLSQDFRRSLLNQLPGNGGVLPPFTGTLNDWVSANITLPDPSTTIISDQSRHLLLANELQQHPDIFHDENKWHVSSALLRLFDQLALNDIHALAQSREDWISSLEQAYNCDADNQHLQKEASLVHKLWQAWQQQLSANNQLDATTAYIERLKQLPDYARQHHFYIVAPGHLPGCEQNAIDLIKTNNQCTILNYEDLPQSAVPEDTEKRAKHRFSQFIHAVYEFDSAPIKQRAEAMHEQQPLDSALSIFYATDAETEARAVELQTRLWLLEGYRNIGIVSEDRKLSRRVRALLERSDIYLEDRAGWSLSTTSAAAVLERWLECIEEDFDYRPMLDLLKSKFYRSVLEHEDQLQSVYRFEHDLILHENIGQNISRYREHLNYRLKRLTHWPADTYNQVLEILAQLEKASHYLLQLYRSEKPIALDKFLLRLTASLEQLGILANYKEDAAGRRILQALESMQTGLAHITPSMKWSDFRTWLSMTLENTLFSPQTETSPVKLMSLDQAQCQCFDALIIAAADRQHLPGKSESSPFFNQSVRKSLGLQDWTDKRAQRLQHFKQLLIASSPALITCKKEDNGEPIPLSPWIESLQNFTLLSKHASLENTRLQQLLNEDTSVFICDIEELPDIPARPMPSLPAEAVPDKMSASAHQRIIDCPYKYFAADALELSAAEEIREELQKSDYGNRIHLILNAFHTQVGKLPVPFQQTLTSANRTEAIEHLAQLSETVFKQDLENNNLHRSWLFRWKQHIPAYIDWQIQQQQQWKVAETEKACETLLESARLKLYGRLDRIDQANDDSEKLAIIDYKTGATAKQEDVDSGEDVQLATYALLADKAHAVQYLSVDDSKPAVKVKSGIEADALETLTDEVKQRLVSIVNMEREGNKLPAWGDSRTCSYCEFSGVCRRKVWDNH
jgi:ATP-dependent helicase/nuclease subunit B